MTGVQTCALPISLTSFVSLTLFLFIFFLTFSMLLLLCCRWNVVHIVYSNITQKIMLKLSLNLCFSAYFYMPWNYDDVVLLVWYYTLFTLIDYFDSHFLIIISCLTSSIGLISAIFHRRLFYSIISFYELLHWDNHGHDILLIVIILDLTWLDVISFHFISFDFI